MASIFTRKGEEILVDEGDIDSISDATWCVSVNGYVVSRVDGKVVLLHRVILGDECLNLDVDHKNGNRLDNRRENLRACTRSQNLANGRKARAGKTSTHKGVCRYKGKKWQAVIGHNDESIYLGRYDDEEEAALAYGIAALYLFGEFSYFGEMS